MKPEAEAGQVALKEERHQYILELLGSEGRVLAADLSSRYRVSEDTIRRDLRELASSGKIQRVHGGALPRRAEAVPFVSRQQIDMESKIAIARAAADMIRDGQVVLIDGGTTNLRIASYLSRERSATIVTNSPPLALALADHPKLSVLMLGGNFLKEARVTTGIETIRQVESIRAAAGAQPVRVQRVVQLAEAGAIAVRPGEPEDDRHDAAGVAAVHGRAVDVAQVVGAVLSVDLEPDLADPDLPAAGGVGRECVRQAVAGQPVGAVRVDADGAVLGQPAAGGQGGGQVARLSRGEAAEHDRHAGGGEQGAGLVGHRTKVLGRDVRVVALVIAAATVVARAA